jgi:hypothetical protein
MLHLPKPHIEHLLDLLPRAGRDCIPDDFDTMGEQEISTLFGAAD